jgi:hypothetical protein
MGVYGTDFIKQSDRTTVPAHPVGAPGRVKMRTLSNGWLSFPVARSGPICLRQPDRPGFDALAHATAASPYQRRQLKSRLRNRAQINNIKGLCRRLGFSATLEKLEVSPVPANPICRCLAPYDPHRHRGWATNSPVGIRPSHAP